MITWLSSRGKKGGLFDSAFKSSSEKIIFSSNPDPVWGEGKAKVAVLTVDDNPDIQHVLHEILSPEFEILQAFNGEEAIQVLEEQHEEIQCITLDKNMPITCGMEALQIIKDSENGWPQIPIIMLTVDRDPATVLRAWIFNVDFYMTKPFSPTDLLALVHKVMEEKRAI